MKKNYILMAILLLMNLFSVTAGVKELFSVNELCNVTITVDKASNILAATRAGRGTELTLTDGANTLQLNNSENPLQISAAEGAKIISCKVDGEAQGLSGDGKLRVQIKEGLNIEITTQALAVDPVVNFSIENPAWIIVKANDAVVADIATPLTLTKGTVLTISAAAGYIITNLSSSTIPSIPQKDGVYTITINEDMTIYITCKAVDPVVTFEIDYPNRVTVVDMDTEKPFDISSGKISVPENTVLEVRASDEKYAITSFEVNGESKGPSGGSSLYHLGITGNTIIAIETSSVVPAVKFVVDNPENVQVYILESEESLDLSKTYELEKNTQLIIKPVSEEVRIASVTANGFKLTPLADGTYTTSVSTDVTFEIKTKGVLPGLTFNVDVPERVNVWSGAEKLDITELVELPAGTEIVIESAADNYIIKSVKAGGSLLSPDVDHKYHFVVSADVVFEIETSASLTLHIVQVNGGTISVFRGEMELHEGDRVETGDVLTFKNVAGESYVFLNYLLNGKECNATYTVSGSEDIVVSAVFRPIKEGYALVTFDIEDILVNVIERSADGSRRNLDPSIPYEIEKGNVVGVYTFSSATYIASCTVNGIEVEPVEAGKQDYRIVIEQNALIKVVTEPRVQVAGDATTNAQYQVIGDVFFKYNGEVAHSLLVPVGAVVDLLPLPKDGYRLEFYYTDYDKTKKFTENTYTVKAEDLEGDAMVVIKGEFSAIPNGINTINSERSYYDVEKMQIVTQGGHTMVYTVSGKIVLESAEENISVAALEQGVYVVKTRDSVFKIVKE